MKSYLFFCLAATLSFSIAVAQIPNKVHSIKLYKPGDQTSFPAIALNSNELLELHFDDLDGDVKNYYYSYQLCNADWTPSLLHPFEYIKGFQNVRITTYRNSSLSSAKYTHYQAILPDRSSYPNRSGNYLLRVFLNGDTTKLVFRKKFVVYDTKAAIAAQIQQPFGAQVFKTHQKIQINVQTDTRTRLFSPRDLKIVVLQNYNWQTAAFLDQPSIYRGNYYEYHDEALTVFPAGKEWRWIDLRSFRLLSDRMQHLNTKTDTTQVYVKPDATRSSQIYVYYRDLNGSYTIETLESINPLWQSDYAYVHFSYFPPANKPLEGRDVYLFGEFTNYATGDDSKMIFNDDRGAYEKTMYLKQGFYNYMYVTLPYNKKGVPDFSVTEGNYWGTENAYTVLVYYRPFGARADELIGFTNLNTMFQRVGY